MQVVNKNNNFQASFSEIERDYSRLSPDGKEILKTTIRALLAACPIEQPKLVMVKKSS
jgi:hypothetical protein